MGDLKHRGPALVWKISILLFCLHAAVNGQIRYSVPEELKKGSVIGNVAQDLGLDVKRLRTGRIKPCEHFLTLSCRSLMSLLWFVCNTSDIP
uniref:Cadherin N-terminal domain-containing protein n=1 Tax=Xiphophorus maculatus TaxID=8083 RepID=A0A3B5QFY5_XIPMA